MKQRISPILRVALPIPRRACFDYLPPPNLELKRLEAGLRIQVPFGHRTCIGVLESVATQSKIPPQKLREALRFIDGNPLWPAPLLKLIRWCSRYYHYPIGETMFTAMPRLVRKGHPATAEPILCWQLSAAGRMVDPHTLKNSPRQKALLELLAQAPAALPENAPELTAQKDWRRPMQGLLLKGWVESVPQVTSETACTPNHAEPLPTLNPDQRRVMQTIEADCPWDAYMTYLLDGVTSSGKTEIYLRLIEKTMQAGKQSLVLLPEIGLTPQTIDRFQKRFQTPIAILHSKRNDREQMQGWQAAREGHAPIILGTRSAIWTPLARPGLIIVDEEHDRAYKQQEGLRYSARDVSVIRAKIEGIPLLLGSATPSLESLFNVDQRRYRLLQLPKRAGSASPPQMHRIDIRRCRMYGAISSMLATAIEKELSAHRQILLFLNRRGYAPVLLCHSCGKQETCSHCDVNMTYHRQRQMLLCHHCNRRRQKPSHCTSCKTGKYLELGHGTERIEQTLSELFPRANLLRFDRDQVQRRSAMQSMLECVHSGDANILIGTQMLAKGHHFKQVSLVGIIDADRQLYSQDFRAIEYMAQQIIQVSGRAGRSQHPGKVLIQTHHPDHPMFTALLQNNYSGLAQSVLQDRKAAGLPPYTRLALLQAEATKQSAPGRFLQAAHKLLHKLPHYCDLTVLGPYSSLMERKAGFYRGQLVVQAGRQTPFAGQFDPWTRELEQLAAKHGNIRWFFDVDPIEIL